MKRAAFVAVLLVCASCVEPLTYHIVHSDGYRRESYSPSEVKRVAFIGAGWGSHESSSGRFWDAISIALMRRGITVVEREKIWALIREQQMINQDFADLGDVAKASRLGRLLNVDIVFYGDELIANHRYTIYKVSKQENSDRTKEVNETGVLIPDDFLYVKPKLNTDNVVTLRAVDVPTGEIVWVGFRLETNQSRFTIEEATKTTRMEVLLQMADGLVDQFLRKTDEVVRVEEWHGGPRKSGRRKKSRAASAKSKKKKKKYDTLTISSLSFHSGKGMESRRLAVIDFAGTGGQAIADIMTINLFKAGYEVVERDRIGSLIAEQKFGEEGYQDLTDKEIAERLGRILNADLIITGDLLGISSPLYFLHEGKLCHRGGGMELAARAFDTKTGEVFWIADANVSCVAPYGQHIIPLDYISEPCKELVLGFARPEHKGLSNIVMGHYVADLRDWRSPTVAGRAGGPGVPVVVEPPAVEEPTTAPEAGEGTAGGFKVPKGKKPKPVGTIKSKKFKP